MAYNGIVMVNTGVVTIAMGIATIYFGVVFFKNKIPSREQEGISLTLKTTNMKPVDSLTINTYE